MKPASSPTSKRPKAVTIAASTAIAMMRTPRYETRVGRPDGCGGGTGGDGSGGGGGGSSSDGAGAVVTPAPATSTGGAGDGDRVSPNTTQVTPSAARRTSSAIPSPASRNSISVQNGSSRRFHAGACPTVSRTPCQP